VHTRAAGVSPPWSVNRTQCGENRPPFDHDATHEQERRASARRGTGNRVCNGDRLFRTQHVRPGTIAFHPTAGLHQPLLVASADAVADVRFVSASPLPTPRLAYASRSWLRVRMLLRMCVSYPQVRYPFPRLAYASRSWLGDVCSVRNATFAMHKRTCTQERRALARRGAGNRVCNSDRLFRAQSVRPSTVGHRSTAGLRQPLQVARRVFRAECDICDAQTHTHKSGGRQPAVGR
jgi:hypothetical protein